MSISFCETSPEVFEYPSDEFNSNNSNNNSNSTADSSGGKKATGFGLIIKLIIYGHLNLP